MPQHSNIGTAKDQLLDDFSKVVADTEALLRAVQQQEQEELSRMGRTRPEPTRVGW